MTIEQQILDWQAMVQIANYQDERAQVSRQIAYALTPHEVKTLENYRAWIDKQIRRLTLTPASAARMDDGS